MSVKLCGLKLMYSRTGPREQGKRYSKGSKKPQKVRQAKQRYKHLKKKYKALSGDAGGSLNFWHKFNKPYIAKGSRNSPQYPLLIYRDAH